MNKIFVTKMPNSTGAERTPRSRTSVSLRGFRVLLSYLLYALFARLGTEYGRPLAAAVLSNHEQSENSLDILG